MFSCPRIGKKSRKGSYRQTKRHNDSMSTFSLKKPFCFAAQKSSSVFQATKTQIIILNTFSLIKLYSQLQKGNTIEDLTVYIHRVTSTKKPITFLI